MTDPKDPQAAIGKILKEVEFIELTQMEAEEKLVALFQAHQQEAFRNGQLDCQKAGDPTNHVYYKEAVQQLLSELLGEAENFVLVDASPTDVEIIGSERAVPVSVIKSKIGELNGES